MKFIVDENLPPRLARWINDHGCEAIHLIEIGLAGADDQEVAAAAAERGACVVTRDTDFDAIADLRHARVVRLTIGNASTTALLAWVAGRWEDIEVKCRAEPVLWLIVI